MSLARKIIEAEDPKSIFFQLPRPMVKIWVTIEEQDEVALEVPALWIDRVVSSWYGLMAGVDLRNRGKGTTQIPGADAEEVNDILEKVEIALNVDGVSEGEEDCRIGNNRRYVLVRWQYPGDFQADQQAETKRMGGPWDT